jgi:hypothetical protein
LEPYSVPEAASHLGETLTSYCFGGLSDKARNEAERHLMSCERCWDEFQRLDAAVRTLRSEALRPALAVSEAVCLMGLSSQLYRAFGGHQVYVGLVGLAYALLFVASVWTELGYAYDRFGTLGWLLSPVVAVWVMGSVVMGLRADWQATNTGRTHGLLLSMGIVLAALTGLIGLLFVVLPDTPTITASFETRSASGGYFKNVLLYFLPLLIFILPPFHVVLRLQHELHVGRHRPVFDLLVSRPEAVPPRGLLFVPRWFLIALLFMAVPIGVLGAQNMLDAVTPGPYVNLFTAALLVRVVLWYVVALIGLVWYHTTLDELKREARALSALERHANDARRHH